MSVVWAFAAGLLCSSVVPVAAATYSFTTIDVPGANTGSTRAFGINTAGQIVGIFSNSTGNHGFVDTAGTFTTINVPGALGTNAFGINAAGQIVGQFNVSPGTHGFLDTAGTFTTIDVPGAFPGSTSAQGINDAGQIVGGFSDSTGGNGHGFLDTAGTFTTIDAPGAGFTISEGINPAGQIVGYFSNSTGFHGFLATPVPTAAVPEPTSLMLLCVGLVVLARRRLR